MSAPAACLDSESPLQPAPVTSDEQHRRVRRLHRPDDDAPPTHDDGLPDVPLDPGLDTERTEPPREDPPGRLRRMFRAVVRIAVILILVGAAGGVWGWTWLQRNVLHELPEDLSDLRNYRPPTSCRVYGSRGELVDEFYLERRIWVPLDELPPYVWQAFIAAEDRRFFEHTGVDFLGIARAMVVNLRAGRSRQGGSTITQQLVKNLLVGKERSYERKLKEAVLAYRLEKALTKQEILELYVNFIALGSGNYGVEAASMDYFGVSARQIDPGQAALLGGLVPAPSRYSPRNNPQLAEQRRSIILRAMVQEGFLDARSASEYLDDPVLIPNDSRRQLEVGSAYVTQVRRELRRVFSADLIFNRGLQVHSPLDLAVQSVAEQAVREALIALEKRQGRRGAVLRLAPDQVQGFLDRAPGLGRDQESGGVIRPAKDECFDAVVGPEGRLDHLLAGTFTFALAADEWDVPVRGTGEKPTAAPLSSRVLVGDVLRVCSIAEAEVRLDPRPWAEGAAVAVENATGRVVALVGGWDVAVEGFVRATQARRQPGSSFKPYVYGAALLAGQSQLDTVVDSPISLPAGNGKMWSPGNYDGKYHGALPMRTAFAKSLNTVAVRMTLQVGHLRIARLAEAMGVATPLRSDPTIGLGSSEVTPFDQAMGYLTIARMGVPAEAVFVDRLTDPTGTIIGRSGEPVLLDGQSAGTLAGGSKPRAMPAGVAYELADMMREVVLAGTARSALAPGYDRAGKTGTTNGFVDAWFVGFTPRFTVAVWIGTDGTSSLGEKETGGKTALPGWIRIVEALPHVEGERFPVPDEAILVRTGERWFGLRRGGVPAKVLAVAKPDPTLPLAPVP